MKKMSAVSMLLLLGVGMLGCNAAKQAGSTPASTSMMAGSWVVTITNFGGQTDTVTVVNPYPNGTPGVGAVNPRRLQDIVWNVEQVA